MFNWGDGDEEIVEPGNGYEEWGYGPRGSAG